LNTRVDKVPTPTHKRSLATAAPKNILLAGKTRFYKQVVGIKVFLDAIWLVSFMDWDLGYFDLETRVLAPLENPFGPRVLPMS
jgi:hypothetical protein